jgi:t-SNARE complex subunit (syntaxin)
MRQAEAIRNVFVDLANLISEQATVIDRIDFCINHTLQNAVDAHTDVETAAQYKRKLGM